MKISDFVTIRLFIGLKIGYFSMKINFYDQNLEEKKSFF